MHEVNTRYGKLTTLDPAHDLISRFLDRYGEWAQNELEFVAANIQDNQRIADIGAFIGTFGIGLSKLRPLASICFVDANPRIVPILRRNVEHLRDVPTQVIESIVGSGEAEYSGSVQPDNSGTFSLVAADDSDPRAASPAAMTTIKLSELDQRYGPFDVVKIDVEGMECEILSADLDYLRDRETTLWLECNESAQSLALVDLLRIAGYRVFYYAFPALRKDNFRQQPWLEFPYACEAGLWATKQGAPLLPDSLARAGAILKEVDSPDMLREALWRTPRWAPEDWPSDSPMEAIALAVHALLGQTFESYLDPQQSPSNDKPKPGVLLTRLEEEARSLRLRNRLYEEALTRRGISSGSGMPEFAMVLSLRDELSLAQADTRAVKASMEELRRSFDVELDVARSKITGLTAELRAREILLQSERARYREAVDFLEAQRHQSSERVNAVYRSRSWRMMMPFRMVGRIARGDWAEVKRLIRARFRAH